MQHIFHSLTQRLRFAFSLMQQPRIKGMVEPSIVRKTLSDVGVSASPEQMNANTARYLTLDASNVVDAALSIPRYESCALVATYSQCWDSRRIAADCLREHYRPLLSHLVNDYQLLRAIVTRHYIAERERNVSWSLGSIAHEFSIEKDKLERVALLVESHAKLLEKAALQSLQARLLKLEMQA